jgi:hypothetical protein
MIAKITIRVDHLRVSLEISDAITKAVDIVPWSPQRPP